MRARSKCLLVYPFDTGLDLDFEKLLSYEGGKVIEANRYYLEKKTPVKIFTTSFEDIRLKGKPLTAQGALEISVYSFGTGLATVSFSLIKEIKDLVKIAEGANRIEIEGRNVLEYCSQFSRDLVINLEDYAIRKYETRLEEEQIYPLFVMEEIPQDHKDVEAFIKKNEKLLLGLIGGEPDWRRFSSYVTEKNRIQNFGYYKDELIIIQDSGALIHSPTMADTILSLVNLAYAQYWTLKVYNYLVESRLERSYELLSKARLLRNWSLYGLQIKRIRERIFEAYESKLELISVLRGVSDVPRISEDWHLSRIYESLSQTFGINELFNIVKEKIDEIEKAYQSVQEMLSTRRLTNLELWIVILIAFEILIIIWELIAR